MEAEWAVYLIGSMALHMVSVRGRCTGLRPSCDGARDEDAMLSMKATGTGIIFGKKAGGGGESKGGGPV